MTTLRAAISLIGIIMASSTTTPFFEGAYTPTENTYYMSRGVRLNGPGPGQFTVKTQDPRLDPNNSMGQIAQKAAAQYGTTADKLSQAQYDSYANQYAQEQYAQKGTAWESLKDFAPKAVAFIGGGAALGGLAAGEAAAGAAGGEALGGYGGLEAYGSAGNLAGTAAEAAAGAGTVAGSTGEFLAPSNTAVGGTFDLGGPVAGDAYLPGTLGEGDAYLPGQLASGAGDAYMPGALAGSGAGASPVAGAGAVPGDAYLPGALGGTGSASDALGASLPSGLPSGGTPNVSDAGKDSMNAGAGGVTPASLPQTQAFSPQDFSFSEQSSAGGSSTFSGGGGASGTDYSAAGDELADPTADNGYLKAQAAPNEIDPSKVPTPSQKKNTEQSTVDRALAAATKYGPLALGVGGAITGREGAKRAGSEIANIPAEQKQIGQSLISQYQAGTLNANDALAVQQYQNDATAKARAYFAKAGLSDSTQALEAEKQIAQQAAAMKSQMLQGYLTQGMAALNLTSEYELRAVQTELQASQQATAQVSNFLNAYGSWLRGNGTTSGQTATQ